MDSTGRYYELILKFGSAHKGQRTCATWRRITYLLILPIKFEIMKKISLVALFILLVCTMSLRA